MCQDLAGMFGYFLIKAGFIPAFLNCPANGRTPTGVNDIPTREPVGYPKFVLMHVSGYRISPKTHPNDAPSDLRNWTEEEKMINVLIFITKAAGWVTNPMSTEKIILCENGVVFN